MVVVLGFRHARPLIAVWLAGAAIVQLFDVQPLRQQFIASIAEGPGAEEFDPGQVARLIAGVHRIEVVLALQPGRHHRQQAAGSRIRNDPQ